MLDILVILDRSGSMQDAKADHEGGLKSFVEDQRQQSGDVRFTLVQFDSHNPCEIVYDRVPLDAVAAITLLPRGATPLLDAIGQATTHLEAQQAHYPAERTVVMVITDGQENSSVEWTRARIQARVKDLEAKGWLFLYLGANVDAFAEAGGVGVAPAHTVAYANSARGIAHVYASTSNNLQSARACVDTQGFTSAMSFSEEQRNTAKKEEE